MKCPYCQQPIVIAVWECHAEQDFCSGECAMRFVYGGPIGEPVPHSLWESLRMLFCSKLEFAHKTDDFADEYFVGPFIISSDVVNDWLLFLNHKNQGYIYITDLNRLVSIFKHVLNGDIETAASWVLADLLDSVGAVISRGHWAVGPFHICCDETDWWSWETMKKSTQHS